MLLLGKFVALEGDRRAVAESLGIGYTSTVTSIREIVPLRSNPDAELRDSAVRGLKALRDEISRLIQQAQNAG